MTTPKLLEKIKGATTDGARLYLPKGTAPDVAAEVTAHEAEVIAALTKEQNASKRFAGSKGDLLPEHGLPQAEG